MRERIKAALPRVRQALKVPLHKRLAQCSDVFELAGIGCLVTAVWMWNPVLGVAALGAALIYLGWVTHELG